MGNYTYLVPANSKKQNLIFGFMLPVDLGIFGVGLAISFILLVILPITEIWAAIIALLPVLIAVFLVFPIPNFHNTRVLIMEIYSFYFVRRRKYVWRGWCYTYEQSDK